MMHNLKAEFRKLLTIRSTYIITLFSFLMSAVLFGFWVYGYKNVGHANLEGDVLTEVLLGAVSTIGVFLSFVAILLLGHEYRYNTIMYSLTSVNRRWKFLAAKYAALVVFSVVIATIIVALTGALFYVGLKVHGISPVAQHVEIWSVLWRSVVTIIGDVTFAFIIVALLRNLIGAIGVVLLLPTTIEGLLGLILKDGTKYLPYSALGNLTNSPSDIHYTFSLAIVVAYIVVGELVTYVLFQKRDAN